MKAFLPAVYVDLGKVIFGNLARNGLRGVTKLLVAGFLTPRGLGILRSIYAIFKLVAALVDFGFKRVIFSIVSSSRLRKKIKPGV